MSFEFWISPSLFNGKGRRKELGWQMIGGRRKRGEGRWRKSLSIGLESVWLRGWDVLLWWDFTCTSVTPVSPLLLCQAGAETSWVTTSLSRAILISALFLPSHLHFGSIWAGVAIRRNIWEMMPLTLESRCSHCILLLPEIAISFNIRAGEMQVEGKDRLRAMTCSEIWRNEVNWLFLQRFCLREKVVLTCGRSWILYHIPVFEEMENIVTMLIVFKMKLSVDVSGDNNPLLV